MRILSWPERFPLVSDSRCCNFYESLVRTVFVWHRGGSFLDHHRLKVSQASEYAFRLKIFLIFKASRCCVLLNLPIMAWTGERISPARTPQGRQGSVLRMASLMTNLTRTSIPRRDPICTDFYNNTTNHVPTTLCATGRPPSKASSSKRPPSPTQRSRKTTQDLQAQEDIYHSNPNRLDIILLVSRTPSRDRLDRRSRKAAPSSY